MGMFDTVYAELDCPFCGRKHRHTPLPWEQAEHECKEIKSHELELWEGMDDVLLNARAAFQPLRAKDHGFEIRPGENEREDLRAWIEQLDSPEAIERWRTRPAFGLAKIQTKVFFCTLEELFIGDAVPAYAGHYYVQEVFACDGCSTEAEHVYVQAWLEIQDHRIEAVHVRNPETGEPEREVFSRGPAFATVEMEHPPLRSEYKAHRGYAEWDEATRAYHGRVVAFSRELIFRGKDKEEARLSFEQAVEEYLALCAQRKQIYGGASNSQDEHIDW